MLHINVCMSEAGLKLFIMLHINFSVSEAGLELFITIVLFKSISYYLFSTTEVSKYMKNGINFSRRLSSLKINKSISFSHCGSIIFYKVLMTVCSFISKVNIFKFGVR